MLASCGRRFSMANPSARLGLSPLHLQTPRRFMQEQASLTFGPLSRSATVSTSLWMAVEPGFTLDWRTHDISAGLSSTRKMQPPSSSEHWDMFTVRTISVASTNPPTVARIGPEFSIKGRKSVSPIWQSVRVIPNFCLPARGTPGVRHGAPTLPSIARVVVFTDLRMLARLGRH